jgi:LCP family protein required for cell wall assembly
LSHNFGVQPYSTISSIEENNPFIDSIKRVAVNVTISAKIWYNTEVMHDEIIINQEELDGSEPVSPDPGQAGKQLPPSGPRRRFNWRRALKWLGITLGLLILAAIIFVVTNLFKVSANPFSFGHLKGESRGRVNIMMLGVGDPGHAGETLNDTNIILSIDTKTHQVAVIGIPRDLRVKIPDYGYGKINNANAQGGIDTAKEVYETNFGVPIDYYVKANFSGLKQVVDAVGGIDINNPDNLVDREYPCDNNESKSCGYRLAAGHYHMNGADALKYVRCRKGTCGDDFGRAARQQQVMQAVRDKATSGGTLTNPIAIGKLVAAAGSNIDTNLSVNNLMRLNQLTKPLDGQTAAPKPINVVFSLDPGGFLISDPAGSQDLLPEGGNFDNIKAFVQSIFKVGPVWSEHPTVMIENGTTTAGIAGKFEQSMDDSYNIDVVSVTNALTRDHATSQIIDYTAGQKSNSLKYFQGLLKVQTITQPTTPTKSPPADIVIILGNDYAATLNTSNSTSR